MTTHSETGSFDLSALNNLNQNLTQYFWFEEGGEGSYPWGLGAHVTLYPQGEFTDPNDSNYLKGQNILINTDGFSLRNGTIPLMTLDNDSLDFNIVDTTAGTYTTTATFSSTGAQIGQIGESHLEMDYHSMRMVDLDGNNYLYVSDLRGVNGEARVVDTFTSEGMEGYYLTYPATSSNYTVTVSDGSGGSVTKDTERFIFTNAPTVGAIVTAEYDTRSEEVKAYTIGIRGTGDIGGSSAVVGTRCVASGKYSYAEGFGTTTTAESYASHVEGWETTASGSGSHAEGFETIASGYVTHAEGRRTTASGRVSHAEGEQTTAMAIDSHAEGYNTTASGAYSHAEGAGTVASGNYSHAEGEGTEARGSYSHAEGYGTIAIDFCSHASGSHTQTSGNYQTVMGSYNDDVPAALLIIGNGTSDNARSHALAVTSTGDVDIAGDVNIARNMQYKINGTALSASDVGAVPTTRTVNNKALSSNITLSASDVGAVPTSRTVNSKALSSNITLTASDVGALATSGGNITGNLSYKSSTIDASLANNGVSSTQYPTTFNILDKSNRILTRKEAVIESNGNISAYWYVRNYNTSGTQVGQKGIKITMDKTGAVTYGVDEPSKFLSALSMNKYTRSSSGALDWSNQTDGDSKVIMKSALAFWNGCYSGTNSNLSYCTQGRIIGRNQICYANSRVDTFSSGVITLSLATLGITTGAKPVGILLTPEYSSGVTMKYDYDGSSASGVKIYAYTANGSAYTGALRYFAVVFQNTWTST